MRKNKVILYLLLLFFNFQSILNAIDCKTLFTSFTSDTPDELFFTTYSSLFKELAGGKIGPEEIETIIKSKDPFTIPTSIPLESSSLQLALNDFKELIEASGKLTEKFKEELLESLKTLHQKQVRTDQAIQVQAKKSVDRKPIEIDWKKPTRDVHHFQDWYITVGGSIHDKNKGWVNPKSIYLRHKSGQEYEIPYESEMKLVINEINPQTGEIWFADRGLPLMLYKMSLFDEKGTPLKKAITQQVPLGSKSEDYSCDALLFSPKGNQFLIISDQKGGLIIDPKKGGAELGKVVTGGMDPHYGFITDKVFFLHSGSHEYSFFHVDTPESPVKLKLNDNPDSISMSPDGKRLYLLMSPTGEKISAYTWEFDKLKANPKTAPIKMDLDHKTTLGDFRGSFNDELFPLDNDRMIQLKRDEAQKRALEFRILDVSDPSKPKQLGVYPLPAVKHFIHEFRFNADHSKILATETLDKVKKLHKTWVWDVEALLGE